MTTLPDYVLITPARDEAEFIDRAITSVLSQTKRPLRWVIVSDGSTDGTDALVQKSAALHPWIVAMRMPGRPDRSFDGKAVAVNAAYAQLVSLPFSVVASLDADVSFAPDHFAFLLEKLAADEALGVVSTALADTYDYRFMNPEHVSGACQVFRRACFEDIGGYQAVAGGVDHIAVITARMRGWSTRTFTERSLVHHRRLGAARLGTIAAKFHDGALDYALGGHPLWELARSAYQLTRPPIVAGGVSLFAGYLWSSLRRAERPVSRDLVKFRRREQMTRLRALLAGARR